MCFSLISSSVGFRHYLGWYTSYDFLLKRKILIKDNYFLPNLLSFLPLKHSKPKSYLVKYKPVYRSDESLNTLLMTENGIHVIDNRMNRMPQSNSFLFLNATVRLLDSSGKSLVKILLKNIYQFKMCSL